MQRMLRLWRFKKAEIVHFFENTFIVYSRANKVFCESDGKKILFKLPLPILLSVLSKFRLMRRMLRLDKMNVVVSLDKHFLVIIYHYKVYKFCLQKQTLTPTLFLKNCRNVLHQSILVQEDRIVFGEYVANKERVSVPVWQSVDRGETWQNIYTFPAKTVKHVHGVYQDPISNNIFITTGDFQNESYLFEFNSSFQLLNQFGDGSQLYRTVGLFFTVDYLYWIMDSQLETSYLIKFDRKTKKIEQLRDFPGPVWYVKTLSDGTYLAATTREIGKGVKTNCAHLFVSKDLEQWEDVLQLEHDGLPIRFFKSGIIGFAEGRQSSKKFFIFGEALKNCDGRVYLCCLEGLENEDKKALNHLILEYVSNRAVAVPSRLLPPLFSPPKGKFCEFSETDFYQLCAHCLASEALEGPLWEWLEKIRNFLESNIFRIHAIMEKRFLIEQVSKRRLLLEWFTALMFLASSKYRDDAYTNIFLKLAKMVNKPDFLAPSLQVGYQAFINNIGKK